MSASNISYRLALIFILCAFSVGCATQTRPMEELTTQVKTKHYASTDYTISVVSVSGGEKTQQSAWVMNTPKVDNEQFRNLLLGSIKKSGLFREVTSKSSGDLLLNAEIIFQEMTVGGLTNTLMLLVKYELTDSSTGGVVFKENIYTQTELSAGDVFAGNIRIVRLLEQGLIMNMNTLIEKIEGVVS